MHRSQARVAGQGRERSVPASQPPRVEREPRDKPKPFLLAVAEHILKFAVKEIVGILNRNHGGGTLRLDDLGDSHFRQSDVLYFAFAPHLFEHADLLCRGDVGVDAVKLI